MALIYRISEIIGYFIPLVIFIALAVIFAKKFFAWILYGAGAALQLLSLVRYYNRYRMFGAEDILTPYWVVFAILLVVGFLLITRRRSYGSYIFSFITSKKISKKAAKEAEAEGLRFCPECGGSVKESEVFCPKCRHKM